MCDLYYFSPVSCG